MFMQIYSQQTSYNAQVCPKELHGSLGIRGQSYLSFPASPAVLLCQSDQGAREILEHLDGQEHHPSLGAPVVLELLPPPRGTESWRYSKPSSLQKRTGTGHRAS